jgi:hypothetical protein
MKTHLAQHFFTLPDYMAGSGEPVEIKTLCSMSLKCVMHKVVRCQACSHNLVTSTVTKGDTLNTRHGSGVVIGFERFNSKGFSDTMADIQKGKERIILKLNEGSTWNSSEFYALYFSEITLYN